MSPRISAGGQICPPEFQQGDTRVPQIFSRWTHLLQSFLLGGRLAAERWLPQTNAGERKYFRKRSTQRSFGSRLPPKGVFCAFWLCCAFLTLFWPGLGHNVHKSPCCGQLCHGALNFCRTRPDRRYANFRRCCSDANAGLEVEPV